MSDLTVDQQIQIAADMIYDDKSCGFVSRDVALNIARRLYDIWMKPGGPQRHIPQGEIAQRFRARYDLAAESPAPIPEKWCGRAGGNCQCQQAGECVREV